MTNSLLLLLPVLIVVAGALVSLALEPFLQNENKHRVLPWIAAVFTVLSIASIWVTPDGSYYHVYALDSMRKLFTLTILVCLFLGIGGVQWTLAREKFPGGEAYGLLMIASVGAVLMTLSTDFLALFIGMELAAFPVYALVGIRRKDRKGNEATFKYFVTGAVFSAIFLYGVAFLYGATGSTSFGAFVLEGRQTFLRIGMILVMFGLLFKAGAAPAHFWVADVYTGAPVAVTAFMAAVVKVGALAAIASLWMVSTPDRSMNLLIAIVAIVSMAIGAFSGLAQNSVRRILAFSAVMNAGFMLCALFLHKESNGTFFAGALQFFLVTYAVASAGALTGIAYLAGNGDEKETLCGLRGLGRKSPGVGIAVIVCLASLAGLPPAAGFLAKFELFTGLFKEGLGQLAAAAFLLSLVAAVYYLRIAYTLFAGRCKKKCSCEGTSAKCSPESFETAPVAVTSLLKAGVAVAAIAMLVLSVFPNLVCF